MIIVRIPHYQAATTLVIHYCDSYPGVIDSQYLVDYSYALQNFIRMTAGGERERPGNRAYLPYLYGVALSGAGLQIESYP
jgi:hypothetical protein